jgi:hypothetical protein
VRPGPESTRLAFVGSVECHDDRRRDVVFVVRICCVVKAYSGHGELAVLVKPLCRPELV